MTPDASVTDGLLDLCVIEAMSRRDFARLSLQVKRGEHLGLPGVHYAQLPWLKVIGRRAAEREPGRRERGGAGVRLSRAAGGSAGARAAPAGRGAG